MVQLVILPWRRPATLLLLITKPGTGREGVLVKTAMRWPLLPLLPLCLWLPCPGALGSEAHQKTDVITLYNGDRITGEIRGMSGGLLELKTHALDTVKIEWQEIAHIDSVYNYQIRLSSGERYYGELNSGGRPGQITISGLYGSQTMDYLEIAEMLPIEDQLIDRFRVYLSAGYSYTKASAVSQVTLNTTVDYEDRNSRNALDARATLTNTNDEDTQSSRVGLVRQMWTDRADLFRGLWGSYESNDELGLDFRVAAGAGAGRYFIDSYRTRLVGGAGLQALWERGADGNDTESLEAFFSGEYALWRFNTPELDIRLNLNLFPSLTESKRMRGNSDIRVSWEIVDDLFWDVTAFGTYDNRAESERHLDYGVSTGLGWKY
jgi:Protein of unknown function, DUF481